MAAPRDPEGISTDASKPVEMFNLHAVATAFDILLIIGFIVSTTVLVTACVSKRIVRSRPWFIFMGFSSCWSIQYLLLLGNQFTEPGPPFALCSIQASLVYAAPPASIFALLCMFFQIFFLLIQSLYNKPEIERKVSSITIGCTILVYVGTFTITLVYGTQHPELVERGKDHLNCHHASGPSPFITAGLAALECVIMVVIEGLIFTIYWKNRNKLKVLSSARSNLISFSAAMRTAVFSLLPLIAAFLSVSRIVQESTDAPMTPIPDLIMACFPLAAGLIFGTQSDMLNVWMFWKSRSSVGLQSQISQKGSV